MPLPGAPADGQRHQRRNNPQMVLCAIAAFHSLANNQHMRWTWLLVATLAPPELTTQIQQFRYPPLARQARIQGTVHLAKTNGTVTLLAGHPILFPTALKATESFPPIPGHDTITVTWHFEITGAPTNYSERPVTIPITNKFARSLRRLFHRKTETVIFESFCESTPPPPNQFTITGPHIDIRIATTHTCLQTEHANNLPTQHPARSGILEGR